MVYVHLIDSGQEKATALIEALITPISIDVFAPGARDRQGTFGAIDLLDS